ncbi:MAG: acyl carrier protein [Acidobacteria bacterium]|nr:acyl carrier protein [Acidobacteriota bacterium]
MSRQAKILEIVQSVAKKQVTPGSDESLFDSGLLDSFALPDLVSALEVEYHVRVPDSDLNPRKFDTIERIESYLEGLL